MGVRDPVAGPWSAASPPGAAAVAAGVGRLARRPAARGEPDRPAAEGIVAAALRWRSRSGRAWRPAAARDRGRPDHRRLPARGAAAGYAIWQGKRVLRGRIKEERQRVERLRADQESRHFAGQAEHAALVSRWQRQRSAFDTQKRWYGVPVPAGIDRVDVAGGTLSGWSGLLTMVAAGRLAVGGEVTVIDLSGGAVAADLVDLSIAAGGVDPAVWVLPRDLPGSTWPPRLAPGELADVLALWVSVAEERSSARELAVDSAILDRVIGALTGPDRSHWVGWRPRCRRSRRSATRAPT